MRKGRSEFSSYLRTCGGDRDASRGRRSFRARDLTSIILAAWLCNSPLDAAIAQQSPARPGSGRRDLTELSLTELANIEVTSVSRKPQEKFQTAAAIHVITREDIQRSGAKSIPELLRYVPGVDVARVHSSQWAVGIRGFTSSLTRSQLVLIDGRSVYTTLFAGTYWDVQDLLLDDVERIEVIRGPGGTLWGANAVNGVVNIITMDAKDTEGGLVKAGGGNEERAFASVRYGGTLGSTGSYRVYGKYFDRDAGFHRVTGDFDGWHMSRAGFRSDWNLNDGESLTLQGDLYDGRAGQRTSIGMYDPPFSQTVERMASLRGGNLRAQWVHGFDGGSELAVQTYFDRTNREEANFRESRNTFDVDTQYRFRPAGRHDFVSGVGFRVSASRSAAAPVIVFLPFDRTDNLFTAFAEDTIDLRSDRLKLTIGSKVERNDYTGFEFQPTARLSWMPRENHFLWGAFTRAVRTPSRVERDLTMDVPLSAGAPVFGRILGNDSFDTEKMLGSEVGYRARLSSRILLDLAAFHNHYPNLLSYESREPFRDQGRLILPFHAANGLKGKVSGGEMSLDLRPSAPWSLRVGYNFLNMALEPKPGSSDRTSSVAEDASPRHSAFLLSSLTLRRNLLVDSWFRWVARRPSQRLGAYAEVDLRLAWRAGHYLELAAVGRNLLHPHHAEFGTSTEIQRSVYGEATLTW